MPQGSEQREKALDWVFKITTALVIPALVWSFKLSTQVAVLEEKIENQKKTIERIEEHFKEQIGQANGKLDTIYETLLKK